MRDAAELGSAIRDGRAEAGLTQAELAAEAGVGRQWLVELEAGDKASAPFDMVMRVLRALTLEVTLDPVVPSRAPRTTDRGKAPTASDIVRGASLPTPRPR